jgi:hypothetical protein
MFCEYFKAQKKYKISVKRKLLILNVLTDCADFYIVLQNQREIKDTIQNFIEDIFLTQSIKKRSPSELRFYNHST